MKKQHPFLPSFDWGHCTTCRVCGAGEAGHPFADGKARERGASEERKLRILADRAGLAASVAARSGRLENAAALRSLSDEFMNQRSL